MASIRFSTMLAALLVVFVLATVQSPSLAQQEATTLVVGVRGEPTSLDPQWHTGFQRPLIYPLLFDRLVKFDLEGNIVGELAEEWELSEDGMMLTFQLREGHAFHDGTPLDAEAVKRSFDRFFDPDMPFTENEPLEVVEEVRVLDDYTVALVLSQPDAFVLNKLIYETASIISPTAAMGGGAAWVDNLESFAQAPVGSGLYRFQTWDRGRRIVLEKNPDHWQADETNIDFIEFRFIPESTSRAIALELGEIDLADNLNPEDALGLMSGRGLALQSSPQAELIYLMFNHMREPWNDVRVRKAIAHAIDREVIIEVLLQGLATEANTVLPPGVFPSTGQEPYEYNPELARQILADAGYGDGLSASFWIPVGSIPASRQVGEAISGMLAEIGIQTDVQIMEHDTWRLTLRAGPEQALYDLSVFGWSYSTGEADRGLTRKFRTANWSPECCNWHYYSNPEVDQLLDTARTLFTDEERRPYYLEVQELLWDDVAMYPLFQTVSLEALSEDLTGFEVLPAGSWVLRGARLNR